MSLLRSDNLLNCPISLLDRLVLLDEFSWEAWVVHTSLKLTICQTVVIVSIWVTNFLIVIGSYLLRAETQYLDRRRFQHQSAKEQIASSISSFVLVPSYAFSALRSQQAF